VTQGYDIALLLRSIGQDVYNRRLQTSTDVYRRLPQTSTTDVYRRLPTSTDVYPRRLPIRTPHRHGCVRKSSAQLVFATMTLWTYSYLHVSCHEGTRWRLILRGSPSPPHTVTNVSVVWSRLKRKHDDSRRDATGLTVRYPGSVYPYFSDSLLAEQNAIYMYSCHSDITLFTALTSCFSRL